MFCRVRDSRITPRFLLHWYWRTLSQHGTAEALLSAGDVAQARREAEGFLQSALSTADPGMQTLAWELKSRVASAENDSHAARQCIDMALSILEYFEIPLVAWRVYVTAWDLYRDENDEERAERYHVRAGEVIMKLAASFKENEPLRKSLLTAAPVRRIFRREVSVCAGERL
jgi:hypothetical protein